MNKRCQLGIHTIYLPRENILFVKEWLAYHALLGVERFYLYDNSGSRGREGSTDTRNKYGVDYHAPTAGLTDAEVEQIWQAILQEFEDKVRVIPWQPRDGDGSIVYGQTDSIRHCIEHFGHEVSWLCAIDMDEFLFSPRNEPLDAILEQLQETGCTRAVMRQKKFADRFDHLGSHITEIEDCVENIDTARWAPKNIVHTDAFDPAGDWNVHGIGIRTGRSLDMPAERLRFNHYNTNYSLLAWMAGFYGTDEPFVLNARDAGMRRYRREIYRACRTYGNPWWRKAVMGLPPGR